MWPYTGHVQRRLYAPARSGGYSRRRGVLSRAAWSRLLALILLFSALPTLTFLGHWGVTVESDQAVAPAAGVDATLSDAADTAAERAEHARHCHTDLASCASQPLPAGIGLLLTQDIMFVLPSRWLVDHRPALSVPWSGWNIVPLVPPPRPSKDILRVI